MSWHEYDTGVAWHDETDTDAGCDCTDVNKEVLVSTLPGGDLAGCTVSAAEVVTVNDAQYCRVHVSGCMGLTEEDGAYFDFSCAGSTNPRPLPTGPLGPGKV
jgi:hypothetical protein